MGNRNDEESLGIALVNDRVGKAVHKHPPASAADRRTEIGMRAEEGDDALGFGSKGLAKAHDLRLVVRGSLEKLSLGFRMKRVGNHPS
jgi:hypothetical protein